MKTLVKTALILGTAGTGFAAGVHFGMYMLGGPVGFLLAGFANFALASICLALGWIVSKVS